MFNHNLGTVPRLYRQARPGADYAWSLKLLKEFKGRNPAVLSKSGLMVGLGETKGEIIEVMGDLRAHNVDMLTSRQWRAVFSRLLKYSLYGIVAEIT